MKIGGWKTRSIFERFAIASQTDIVDALQKLERTRLQAEHEETTKRNQKPEAVRQ
jgi:hypothetical protein